MKKIPELRKQVIKINAEIDEIIKSRIDKLGETVKFRRKELGMTQEELSLLVGLSRPQITNIENGTCGFTISNMITLCVFLDLDPNTLLTWGYN